MLVSDSPRQCGAVYNTPGLEDICRTSWLRGPSVVLLMGTLNQRLQLVRLRVSHGNEEAAYNHPPTSV